MSEAETLKTLKQLRWMARFMDGGWGIPFTRFRLGADAFSGLLPVGGDAIMVLASLYLVNKARQLGAPREMLIRMAGNVAIEAGLGAIPFVGGIMDVVFQANIKNVDMLEAYLRDKGFAV
ncbi:MAG: DUF4112 domain-containing protein [Pseudomonadota bacterium]|nr:DUF4112 domain-containing protein [Pseudomonadota bacterium]